MDPRLRGDDRKELMLNDKAYLNPKLFDDILMHQKTVLADGFNASVGSKLSIVSQAGLIIIYHKVVKKSNFTKYLRGPDGIRTRTSCLRYRQSAINLPAQLTEAGVLLQNSNMKVNLC